VSFLVTRAKGLRHNNTQHDFSNLCVVIENNGGTYALPYGAGSESVAEGKDGYNASGQAGKNSGGSHPYKYPYKAIWVDVTQILTKQYKWKSLTPNIGYYESHIGVSTSSGAVLNLNIAAQYIPNVGNVKPFVNTFAVDQIYIQDIPFSEIAWRDHMSKALDVASVRYASTIDNAQITLSSDPLGNETNFFFTLDNGNATFQYRLAARFTTDYGSMVEILPNRKTFSCIKDEIISPIDGSEYDMFSMDGIVSIYLNPATKPTKAGTYTSTIYLVVKKD